MTFLELDAYIQHLPSESATQTLLRDRYSDSELAMLAAKARAHGPWSKQDMLLAAVYDALQFLIHVQISKTGAKTDLPEPMSRPGVVSRLQANTNPQAQAYLQAILDRNLQAREQMGE